MKLAVALLFGAALWGQGGITPPQLRISPPAPAVVRMLAIVNGRFQVVEIGSGVSLTPISGGYKLDAEATALVLRRVRLTRQADGSYTGAPIGALLYRNGILQAEEDYTRIPGLYKAAAEDPAQ